MWLIHNAAAAAMMDYRIIKRKKWILEKLMELGPSENTMGCSLSMTDLVSVGKLNNHLEVIFHTNSTIAYILPQKTCFSLTAIQSFFFYQSPLTSSGKK